MTTHPGLTVKPIETECDKHTTMFSDSLKVLQLDDQS